MVLIPYALTYRAMAVGRLPKLVHCEECGHDYVYMMEATGTGQATSMLFLDNDGAEQGAASQARAEVESALHHGCEPIPCPNCGCVQQHMIPRAQQLHRRWMLKLGIGLLIASCILGAFSCLAGLVNAEESAETKPAVVVLWVLFVASLIAGFLLTYFKITLSQRYDPNDEPAGARRQTGRDFSLSVDEFIKWAKSLER